MGMCGLKSTHDDKQQQYGVSFMGFYFIYQPEYLYDMFLLMPLNHTHYMKETSTA